MLLVLAQTNVTYKDYFRMWRIAQDRILQINWVKNGVIFGCFYLYSWCDQCRVGNHSYSHTNRIPESLYIVGHIWTRLKHTRRYLSKTIQHSFNRLFLFSLVDPSMTTFSNVVSYLHISLHPHGIPRDTGRTYIPSYPLKSWDHNIWHRENKAGCSPRMRQFYFHKTVP